MNLLISSKSFLIILLKSKLSLFSFGNIFFLNVSTICIKLKLKSTFSNSLLFNDNSSKGFNSSILLCDKSS